MDSTRQSTYSRRLRFEPLESRRVLSITVDTLVDENDGVGAGAGTSLREAIAAAAAGDTIDFSVAGTMDVLGQLVINKNLTIAGPGANLLTLSAHDPTPGTKNGDGTRVFFIGDNNGTNLLDVSISGLTLTGGDVSFDGGGAIWTSENTVVSDCVIVNNRSGDGGTQYSGGGAIQSIPVGGLFPLANSLTVRNSVLSGNSAPSEGGAIRKRYGTLVIEDCTISGNTANYGGGLSASDHQVNVQINRSTFSNNRATLSSGYGGGIFTYNATVTVTASIISGNTAPRGGGIDASNSYLTLSDSVISNNSATGSSFPAGGAGILAQSFGVSITRCTISGNTSTSQSGGGVSTSYLSLIDSTVSGNSAPSGGGVYTSGGGKIVGSTFSGNTASSRGAATDGRGPLLISFSTITANTSPVNSPGAVRNGSLLSSIIAGNTNGDVGSGAGTRGYNLVGTVGFNGPGDQTGVTNPMLGPLADNGGPTKTHAPLPGSPAIDTGNPTFNPANPDGNASTNDALPFDQRGGPFARVFGGRIDKGAVESQPVSATVMGDYNQDGVVDAADYLVWQKIRGTTGVTPYTGADGSGNGNVDQADYSLWRFHFGSTVPTAGAGSGASSAEPAASFAMIAPTAKSSEDLGNQPLALQGVDVASEMQADVGRSLQTTSLINATFSTAGQTSSGTRMRTLAKPVAPEGLRDDALVGWLESASSARESRAIEFEAIGSDSTEPDMGARSCEAFDVAVGELMSAALL